MNVNQRPKDPVFWIGLLIGCVLLVGLVAYQLYKPRSAHIRIRINDQGVAWLGPIPLRNQKVRDLVLTTAHEVYPKTPFQLAGTEGPPFTNEAAVLTSLLNAGVPLCTMVTHHMTLPATPNAPHAQ